MPLSRTLVRAPTKVKSPLVQARTPVRDTSAAGKAASSTVIVGQSTAGRLNVPSAERAAYTRWYGNVLVTGRVTPAGDGSISTTTAVYDRFKKAQARVRALVAQKGTRRFLSNYGPGAWKLWKEADNDGLAAYDRVVIGNGPTRDPNRDSVATLPKALGDWFINRIQEERGQLGVPPLAAVANVVRRGLTPAEKQVLLGFNITPDTASFFTPPAAVNIPMVAPGARALIDGGGGDGGGIVYDGDGGYDADEEERKAKLRNTAILTGAGAGAGALTGHLMKKSKGWGALIGAGAGLFLGMVLPTRTESF